MKYMTQEEVRAAFPQLSAATKHVAAIKQGDGSKYGKRHVAGQMNQTESAYESELSIRKRAGEVIEYWFESVNLKIADKCRYLPDFMVMLADGTMQFVDVKSPAPIDPKSLVKIKVAAKLFPMWRFVIAQKQKGGGFNVREF